MAAHSLLKIFSIEPILAALNSSDGKWIYSLNYAGLTELIVREQKKIEFEQRIIDSRKPIDHKPENVAHIPKVQTKPNIFDKLKD